MYNRSYIPHNRLEKKLDYVQNCKNGTAEAALEVNFEHCPPFSWRMVLGDDDMMKKAASSFRPCLDYSFDKYVQIWYTSARETLWNGLSIWNNNFSKIDMTTVAIFLFDKRQPSHLKIMEIYLVS